MAPGCPSSSEVASSSPWGATPCSCQGMRCWSWRARPPGGPSPRVHAAERGGCRLVAEIPPGGIVPVMDPGYADHKDAVQKRLRRIEGQVRGLQRMVDEDQYCIDV